MSVYSWLTCRETGQQLQCHLSRNQYISQDFTFMRNTLWKHLYKKTENIGQDSDVGCFGVFGLKYSSDGKLLVAACEKDAIVVVDPLTSKVVQKREHVHTKRCNTITFVDERLFATCSDDHNISLWDVRNLNEQVLLLAGHTGWVKNLEFHRPSQQLLSAGFDDQVLAWDINRPSKNGMYLPRSLLKCGNLIRMRTSADGQSMYLSTLQTADLIAIHNLDVERLSDDIGFITATGKGIGHTVAFKNHERCYNRNGPYDEEFQSAFRRNHVDLYYGHYEDKSDDDVNIFCQSMDVHPENMAVLMRYDRLPDFDSKFISVHNTWSYYSGKFQGNNMWLQGDNCNHAHVQSLEEAYLPMLRGQPTNIMVDDGPKNIEYIQEICFSPCGRLMAIPCGFGIRLLAYDNNMPDYRTHLSSRIASTHQWDVGGDRVLPAHLTVEPEELHIVRYCFGHRSLVLSTAFSPTHMQIASGSKDGQIVLFEVVL